jgi:hypothetical protein
MHPVTRNVLTSLLAPRAPANAGDTLAQAESANRDKTRGGRLVEHIDEVDANGVGQEEPLRRQTQLGGF